MLAKFTLEIVLREHFSKQNACF